VTTRLRLLAGGGVVVAVAAIFAAFQWWRVCDEQVTATGRIVTVCRHMATTDPPVVVLGALTLVLLSMFYAEISGFGVTLRRKVAEIDERADELQETVGDLAEFNREQVMGHGLEFEIAGTMPDTRISDLAKRYNSLRWTMPSGRERTRRMSEVVRQMQEILRDATDFDVAGHLAHDDRGMRLAAYAYLQTHTVPESTSALVDAAVHEEKPFGQFSALRAARHQRDTGVVLGEHDRLSLREMRDRVGQETDRGQLITALLDG
jgi:hypothetical protein